MHEVEWFTASNKIVLQVTPKDFHLFIHLTYLLTIFVFRPLKCSKHGLDMVKCEVYFSVSLLAVSS